MESSAFNANRTQDQTDCFPDMTAMGAKRGSKRSAEELLCNSRRKKVNVDDIALNISDDLEHEGSDLDMEPGASECTSLRPEVPTCELQ